MRDRALFARMESLEKIGQPGDELLIRGPPDATVGPMATNVVATPILHPLRQSHPARGTLDLAPGMVLLTVLDGDDVLDQYGADPTAVAAAQAAAMEAARLAAEAQLRAPVPVDAGAGPDDDDDDE